MNVLAIIVGIVVALLAPVLVMITSAIGAVLNLYQGAAAEARTARKPADDEAHSSKDAEVVKMPEVRRGVEEPRSAA